MSPYFCFTCLIFGFTGLIFKSDSVLLFHKFDFLFYRFDFFILQVLFIVLQDCIIVSHVSFLISNFLFNRNDFFFVLPVWFLNHYFCFTGLIFFTALIFSRMPPIHLLKIASLKKTRSGSVSTKINAEMEREKIMHTVAF